MPSSDEQRDEKRKTRTVVVRHYRPDPHAEEKAIRTLLAEKRKCKEEERHDS